MPQNISKYDYYIASFAALFFLCLYLFCLNDNMTHAHDAETYYHNILNQPTWHGNHLIYEFAAHFWHDLWRGIIPESISSFRLIASMNSVFGAVLTGIIFLFFRNNIDMTRIHSGLASAMIGFSFYFLTYSATIEIYMPVLCLSFLGLFCIHSMKISMVTAIIIGLLHGVAMLWHQMAFLFGFVFILYFLPHKKHGLIYLLTGTIIVFLGYGYAAWDLNINNMPDLLRLFSGYFSNDTVLSHRENSPPYLAIMGLGIALLGGRAVMAVEPFKTMIETDFANHSFQRLIYLHHQTSQMEMMIQLMAYGLFVICFLSIIYHYICSQKEYKKTMILWILLIIHSLFFIFWFPHNPEFWAVQMICCIGVLLQTKPNILISFMTLIAIIVINMMGTALPLKNPDNDIYYQNKILDLS